MFYNIEQITKNTLYMYTLLKEEGLYLVENNHFIVANKVEITDSEVICRSENKFRENVKIVDKKFKLGEVGIFHKKDTHDLCSRPLRYLWDIYNFHEDLYAHNFMEDDPNEF